MRRGGFTMIELVTTIVIMGILAGGTYISLSKLYLKKARSKALSELSFDSARIANQISALLYERVPATAIGYDMTHDSFESIYSLSQQYGILEWISQDFENYKARYYSALIDFDACDKNTLMLTSPDTNITKVLNSDPDTALMFAGSFDEGDISYNSDASDYFGWHGHQASHIFGIKPASKDENITLDTKPDTLYEKYYLVNQAFAIARASDINASCNSLQTLQTTDNTLLLFYNYKPWKGENFCDDANATILSSEAGGFEAAFVNGNLQFNLTLQRTIKNSGKKVRIEVSKEKVVF